MSKKSPFFQWVSAKTCLVPGCIGGSVYHEDNGEWLVDPHHVRTRGAGGKDEDNLVPLCRRHHSLVHQIGMPSFEDTYRVRLNSIARKMWDEWKRKKAREREE